MGTVDERMTRRRFLASTGAMAGLALAGGLSGGAAGRTRGGLIQQIDEIHMYVTHYAFFEEPDPDIPAITYLDSFGNIDHTLDLTPPIAEQRFEPSGRDPVHHVQTSASFKAMPYRIAPPGISQAPAPSEVIGALQFFLGLGSPAAVLAHLQTMPLAIGQFVLPAPAAVTARLDGRNFEVTKDFHFRVQIRVAFVYDDGTRALGILSSFITNAQAAAFLGITSVPHPGDPLTYEWGAPLTLRTQHHYVRQVAIEPPPVAKAFDPGLTEINLRGSHIDDAGRYTIVGSVSRPRFIESPTSSVPEILNVLFGSTVLPDVELAYAESGVLIPASGAAPAAHERSAPGAGSAIRPSMSAAVRSRRRSLRTAARLR